MYLTYKIAFQVIFCTFLILFYCEYLHYYVILYKCDWPTLQVELESHYSSTSESPLKVMILADTHLLGFRTGHWFDRIRREWQMHQTFQIAMQLHKPEYVFILGDLLDEGHFCSADEFQLHVNRFEKLFKVPNGTKLHTVVGNHDIGFHYRITPYVNDRFIAAFNSSGVQLISIKGVHFILLNSMALEGDGCFLCLKAELKLTQIQKMLKCANKTAPCSGNLKLQSYSRPILMQHFPLFRRSDKDCNEPDEAPHPLKRQVYREGWDCLTEAATFHVLDLLQPRLVFTGHSHHGCTRNLSKGNGLEITIPSFNWRNKNNPSFTLMVVTPNNYAVSKCLMPEESTIITTYSTGLSLMLVWIIFYVRRSYRKCKYKYL